MLESIRKHSKFVMILLFLLIIPSFIFVGIDRSYFSESSPTVARVDGHDIKQSDWDNMHRMESDRIRGQNPAIDAKLLDSPQARYATLERMVRDRVLSAAAQKMHLVTSDAALVRTLQGIPAIADLKRPDGSLDAQAYAALVGAQGLTPEGFEANLRRDLSISRVLGGVMNTSFATPVVADLAMDSFLQRREIEVALFKAADFAGKAQATDADLQAFYQQHTASFQQAEQARIEYVVLNLDAVRAGIALNEDDLRTYYKENVARLSGKQEERRASHILINAGKDMSEQDRAAAKAKAQALLDKLRKEPASFAAVAKAESQDTGSAASGGDLGFFQRGAMVGPFEQAAFGMKKGEISDLVESEFGYHIIQLTDVKTPVQPSFEELRPKIEAELKQQQAQRKYAEVAETFSNTVYEQADSLEPVASKLGLKIQKAEGVGRVPVAGASGPLANPRFLEALFSSDALEAKRNTDAVEIGANQLVAGRVVAYEPARTLAFDEVKARVQQQWMTEKSAALAKAEGQSRLEAWKAAPASARGLSAPLVVSRDNTQGQVPAVVDAVLHAPTDAWPAWLGVDLGNEGFAIVKVNKIVPNAQKNADIARQALQQYVQLWSTAEGAAYYELLKKKFDVQFKVVKP